MNTETPDATPWQSALAPAIDKIMRTLAVPGMLIAVGRGEAAPEVLAVGSDADGIPLAADSLLPVTSITKLATALAVLRLAAAGDLALDAPLARYAPEAAASGRDITLRALLSHTAGMPEDLPDGAAPYQPGLDWPALARACLATPPAAPPHTEARYDNVGSGLLAIAVERVTHQPFPSALADLVLAPLGVEGYLGAEPPRRPARIAGAFGEHTGADLEPINSAFWRSLALPWGGLVTTASGALRLARAFAGAPAGFLPPSLLADATADQTGGLPGGFAPPLVWPHNAWGLGVELRGQKRPHWAPREASAGSFGHVGASGCIAWFDPAAGVGWAMHGTRAFQGWWKHWPVLGSIVLRTAGGDRGQLHAATP